MEAPEKIYLTQLMLFAAPTIRSSDNEVEYVRKNAFVEKADTFISSFFHPDDNELKKGILDEFHKYMEGE